MKGKIISINPKYVGQEHESFTSNNKKFYVFITSVEIDGKIEIGDANSTSQQPKWKTNEECEVTVENNDKATGGKKFRFNFGTGEQGGRTGYGKPVLERMEIISQSSFSTAINYINILTEEERKAIFEKYGPDDALINFAKRISKEITKNSKELATGDGS